MSKVEHAKYDVIAAADTIEIRQYPPMIVAEVTVQGARTQAIGDGFRMLADYIFGNNVIRQPIAMTAPVQQQLNTTIAMTAPVLQQPAGDDWQIRFVMPSAYTLATLPQPNNPQVTLKSIPEQRYVAIRFSGSSSDDNLTQHAQRLQHYIETHNIQTQGTPQYAFYNPPWTPPFMRRNEIMMQIQ